MMMQRLKDMNPVRKFFQRFVDFTSELRCSSAAQATARVLDKHFVNDCGFGDCAQKIVYEFTDFSGNTIIGEYAGMESNFYNVKIGDEILIRFVTDHPHRNMPLDALGIIRPAKTTQEAASNE
jgi:hypothetical protein